MAKSTKTLSGQAQRKYFRELFRAEPGVAPEAAERLTEACASEIAVIRVRLPLAKRRPVPVVIQQKAAPERGAALKQDAKLAAAPVPPAPVPEAGEPAPFDPNAFSLIVMLRKQGKDALFSTLEAIGDVGRLREIARAQHVAVEATITDLTALVEAIVAGTEKRVASRQAAAS